MYKNQIIKTLTVTALVLSLIVPTAQIFAKENKNNRDNENNNRPAKVEVKKLEQKEKKEEKKEQKAENKNIFGKFRNFGGLFIPGWITNDGQFKFANNFHFPFWGRATSTSATTTDTVVPVISDLKVNVGVHKATVKWVTDERSNSAVFFGTSTPVDTSTSSARYTNNGRVYDHIVNLNNLKASTTYYLVARSQDPAGNVSYSNTVSFVTKATTTDTQAPALNNVRVVVGTSTLEIKWITNELADSKVYYSTTTPVATSSAYVFDAGLITNHALTIADLATSTKYYFKIESQDADGNLKRSTEYHATTAH